MTDFDTVTGADGPAEDADPFYSYKASLAGAPMMLWLRRDGLEWSVGRHAGLIRYDRVRRVRLTYRPASLQSHRFIAEIWPTDGPKIRIVSTSWHGLAMQQRQDGPYAAFIVELHRRLAAAGSTARLQCGMAAVAHAIGLAVVGATTLTFAGLMLKAAQLAEWKALAVIAALFAVFGWQLGNYFLRNRPGEYRPDAVPPRVLPRG